MAPADDGSSGGTTAAFEPYLRAGEVAFGPRDAALLRAVDDHGSLNAAADALGRSYARAHERLSALEAAFGSLLDRQRGGAGGGGSELAPAGRDLLARFDRLREAFAGTAAAEEAVLSGRVLARDGELATVETAAGRLRALAPGLADAVEVSVRADAVTLLDPGSAPPPGATSARNRLSGRVESVDRLESVVRVEVAVDGATLVAFVTADSVDRLDLAAGRAVVATFKATTTRAVPRRR